ncbi:MAG: endo-1,4-beta-xylanase [Planctomycetota bacterium]
MLSFSVYSNGRLAEKVNLAGAYVVGSDDVPLLADLNFKSGVITCKKRGAGPSGLALLWPIADVGTVLLETVRLLERPKPYSLQLELARGRLLRISQKMEDWGLLNYPGTESIVAEISAARESFISALQADDPIQVATLAEDALKRAVIASEALTRFHAEMFLARRKQSGGFPRRLLGCAVPVETPLDLCQRRLAGVFDFVTVPMIWRDVEPSEQTFNWKPLDALVENLAKNRMPMKGSPLLSFSEKNVPSWLYTWQNDFDTVRDLAFEHARRVVNRYGQHIQTWDVISGIHANTCLSFTFEQLMELTRMTAALVKQASPRSTAIIDLVAPWGEYYARNQRTIPPLLYADMAAQGSVNFDAFGVQLLFGPAVDGMFVRDLFQVSSLLDQFAKLSKPVHVTAVQVPSEPGDPSQPGGEEKGNPQDGGFWHGEWSDQVQADWLRQFMQIALSKPFVDSVSWHDVFDHPRQSVLGGGLLRQDMSPKPAYQQWQKIRGELLSGQK